jgi:hypothetical protein
LPRARIVVALAKFKQREKTYFIDVFAIPIFLAPRFRGRGDCCTRAGAASREGARTGDGGPFGVHASLSGVAVFFVVL